MKGRKPSRVRSNPPVQILAMVLVGMGLVILGLVAFLVLPESNKPEAAAKEDAVVPQAVDFPAPALKLSDLEGKEVSLSDYLGRVVLVNNWATWCPPCEAEMPTLEAYYQDHRAQGFVLVGIEAGELAPEVSQFVEKYALTFPIWLDPGNEALERFHNSALPSSYLVGKDGNVILGWTGPISRDGLEQYVTPLLEN